MRTEGWYKESNDNEKVNGNKQTYLNLLEKYNWLVETFLTANIFIFSLSV